MARYQSTITDQGAAALTAAIAAGAQLILTKAAVGDGICQGDQGALSALISPLDGVDAELGEKEYIANVSPPYIKIPVQITNAHLTAPAAVREIGIFAQDEEQGEYLFAYAWLDGGDSDNILPVPAPAAVDSGDSIHLHELALLATNQEDAAITIEIGAGSYVTQTDLTEYAAPKTHTHTTDQVTYNGGSLTEALQDMGTGGGSICKTCTIPAEGWTEGEPEDGYYWFERTVTDADVGAADMVVALAADMGSIAEVQTIHAYIETSDGSFLLRSDRQHDVAITLQYEICKAVAETSAGGSEVE